MHLLFFSNLISILGSYQNKIICEFVAATNAPFASDMTWACNGLNPATTICLGNMSTWNGITCEDGCITEIILDGSQLVNGNRKERVLWIENNVQLAGTLVSAIGNLLSLRSLARSRRQ